MAKRISADLVSYLTKETEISNVHYPYNVSLAAGPDEYLAVWMENNLPLCQLQNYVTTDKLQRDVQPLIDFADMGPGRLCQTRSRLQSFLGICGPLDIFDYLGTTPDILGTLLRAGQDIPLDPPFPVSYVNYLDGGFYDGQQRFACSGPSLPGPVWSSMTTIAAI